MQRTCKGTVIAVHTSNSNVLIYIPSDDFLNKTIQSCLSTILSDRIPQHLPPFCSDRSVVAMSQDFKPIMLRAFLSICSSGETR